MQLNDVDFLNVRLVLYRQEVRAAKKSAINDEYYEVLLRLKKPCGGLISPGDFLEKISNVKCCHKLDRQIVLLLFDYLKNNPSDKRKYGINLSPDAIEQNGRFFQFLIKEIVFRNIDPSRLIFEVNENSAATSRKSVQSSISYLESIGCKIALDDFGIRFLNFMDVKNLKPNYIKIDAEFIRDLTDPLSLFVTGTIISLSKLSGALSVAEGVETAQQYQKLKEMGCDFVQGYFIDKPTLLYDPIVPQYPDLD